MVSNLANRKTADVNRGTTPPGPAGGPAASAPNCPAHAAAPPDADHATFAAQLRDHIPSLFTYMTLGRVLRDFPPEACKLYRDRLLADCGSPSDPVEVMVLEQLANAHMNIGVLNFKAAATDSVEAASVYWAASARLQAEFRRGALAIQAYRAAALDLDDRKKGTAKGKTAAPETQPDAKLATEDLRPDGPENTIPFLEIAAGRGLAINPPKEQGVHAGGPRKAAAGGAG